MKNVIGGCGELSEGRGEPVERYGEPVDQHERFGHERFEREHPGHERVLVAMSGGVDSTVAAVLLVNKGFNLAGMTAKMFGSNVCGTDEHCLDAFLEQVDSAKAACRKLGIEHYTFNCKAKFEQSVIDTFVNGYLHGETPNPCVDCNKHVKFGELQKRRRDSGFDKLATGHYARIHYDAENDRWKLLRAVDLDKDQSYMLFGLTQDQLAHTLFPLGDLRKSDVRDIAAGAGMRNADAEESQDICFVADGDYLGFVKKWVARSETGEDALAPGEIRDMEDNILGNHNGIAGYTIGQRKGIGIAASEPFYVIDKDAQTNTLIVGPHKELMRKSVCAHEVNYVSISEEQACEMSRANGGLKVLAKTSYRQQPRPAVAIFTGSQMTVEFNEPLVRPAPGQAIVLYDEASGQELLAGGTIV